MSQSQQVRPLTGKLEFESRTHTVEREPTAASNFSQLYTCCDTQCILFLFLSVPSLSPEISIYMNLKIERKKSWGGDGAQLVGSVS